MKVSVADFGKGLALFESELISGIKSSFFKFAAGAVLGSPAMKKKVDDFLGQFADADGMIDTDAVRAMVDAGMNACGGQFKLSMDYGVFGRSDTTITVADVEKFFAKTLPGVTAAPAA